MAVADGLIEIGSTGLERAGGIMIEEYLRDLRGIRGARAYREMRDNDAVVGSVLFAVSMLLRNADWKVSAAGEEPEQEDAAAFLAECMTDMSHSWDAMLTEILSMLVFGWSYHEIVYKRRAGAAAKVPSAFGDGKIGWRKIAIRGQETLSTWDLDEAGGLQGMVQLDAYAQRGAVLIPIDRALLFRPSAYKGNPEGRSVLRSAYRSWYFKKRIEEIQAIGVERDLAGLPVLYIPNRIMKSTEAGEVATLSTYKDLIRNIRRDEQEGVILPGDRDANGHRNVELTLLSTGGRRSFDTTAILTWYNQQIAMSVLADFILLGQAAVGSFALSSDKTALFASAIQSWLRSIAEVFNRHAIPRLWQLNGFPAETMPTLAPGDIETPNLKELGDYISALAGAGAPLFPDDRLESHLRFVAGLPQREE